MSRTLAAVSPDEIADVCGADPGWVCITVLRRTESADLAQAADALIAIPLRIALIIVISTLTYVLLRRGIQRFVRSMEGQIQERLAEARERTAGRLPPYAETRRLQRLHAIGGLLRGALSFTIFIAAVVLILIEFGVQLGPVLAGAGLVGLALGFGAQNLVRDFLAGVSMLIEDQFGVGDWIDAEGAVGEVERVGLRTTRLRDLDGVVWHIPNGTMTKVGNLSQEWARATLDVRISLDTDIAAARQLVKRVADGLWKDPDWGWRITSEPEVWGLQELSHEGMAIRLVLETRPMENWPVLRELNERLKYAMDEAGIWMPQPRQLVWVYRGDDSEPDGDRIVRSGEMTGTGAGAAAEETGPIRDRDDPLPGDGDAAPDA